MKWTTILIALVCSTAISVLAATDASGQGLLEKRVTIRLQNEPLRTALDKIAAKAHVSIAYTNEVANSRVRVNVDAQKMALKQLLAEVLATHPFSFAAFDDEVVVRYDPSRVRKTVLLIPAPEQAPVPLQEQRINVAGKVIHANERSPLFGVTVLVKGSNVAAVTNEAGDFLLRNVAPNATLIFSMIGFNLHEVKVQGNPQLLVRLSPRTSELEGVTVASTGYQQIPKERATGSFSVVTNAQLERRPGSDLLSRLEGFASGLSFHRTSFDESPKLVIRGRSTIYANDEPLVVLDGFPIEGKVSSINPNDVESVTVLKDAAAASIWGVRAANGVIVITTKRGRFQQKPSVEFRSHVKIGAKPDLFYLPVMSTSDYIDMERFYFDNGVFDRYPVMPPHRQQVLSPVIRTLFDQKNGKITEQEAEAYINALRGADVRNEYTDVFFRNSVQQQYLLNLRGGSEFVNYFFSAGYDKNLSNQRGNYDDRMTLKSDNVFRLMKNLDVTLSLTSAWTTGSQNAVGLAGFQGESRFGVTTYSPDRFAFYPYQQLVDDAGDAVVVPRKFNADYMDYLDSKGFQDWRYRPADEWRIRDNKMKQQNTRVALGANYTLIKGLKLDLKYQFEKEVTNNRDLQPLGLYTTRNLINQYTQISADSSRLTNNIPVGDILVRKDLERTAHSFRGQVDYNNSWNNRKHTVAAIAGADVREILRESAAVTYYGYDSRVLSFGDVDLTKSYPRFPEGFGTRLMPENSFMEFRDRFISFFVNASYTYADRYTVSFSGRQDRSNIFGVNPKDRNVPLWSAGASWNIDREQFMRGVTEKVSMLRLRATYGSNGNISSNMTAFPVAGMWRSFQTGLMTAQMGSPANPLLQWEKVNQLNVGLDFGLWNNVFSGSVEWFNKKGRSLLGDHFLDPSSGFSTIRANVASMKGNGIDVELNVRTRGTVRLESKLLLSHAKDVVTDIAIRSVGGFDGGSARFMKADKDLFPIKGKPVYAVYSYDWAGLDAKGYPQLYGADGRIGDLSDIITSLPVNKLRYHGPAQPVFFGGWSATANWKNWGLSTSISYKFGHKFRRASVNYSMMEMLNGTPGHKDFAKRWKKPGDELHTNVPAIQAPAYDQFRDPAYLYSNLMVEDASHIRWREVMLSYNLSRMQVGRMAFKSIQLYAMMENLGLIWRANKHGIDPDYVPLSFSSYLVPPRMATVGFKIEL